MLENNIMVEKKPVPLERNRLDIFFIVYLMRTNSIRLFFALPSGVLLSAMG